MNFVIIVLILVIAFLLFAIYELLHRCEEVEKEKIALKEKLKEIK